ncbi:uncharacterized protein N7529_002269 [Penicillium soppii]|uniref:uncharacterized protein n=1 Tax=Penicillium soppii TaxID=69789 RepID=UPI00254715B9|nr:uncharacterized protein N7529_002269 [Penicillium soppii]KAJ5873839.1 hypothetical protein N7529_002269 [Penicillium soppii]
MKFSATLVALVAATLAQAQLPDVPTCSLQCFLTALGGDGCSELLDFNCHCQKTSLVSTITPCVQKACGVSDQISVSNAVVAQCSSAGHPISVPPIATTSASSASASESSSSSSAPAETSATPTATASATGSSSAAESSSAASSSAAESSSAAGSHTAGHSSGAATSTHAATKTGSASSSASSPVYTGAAANVKGNLAGVAAFAAAAAYVL